MILQVSACDPDRDGHGRLLRYVIVETPRSVVTAPIRRRVHGSLVSSIQALRGSLLAAGEAPGEVAPHRGSVNVSHRALLA